MSGATPLPRRPAGRTAPWLAAVLLLAAACAAPWTRYPVAPAISGIVLREGVPLSQGRVRRTYRSIDTATLGGEDTVALSQDGRFAFGPASLAVAGREYRKGYFVALCLVEDECVRPLWKFEYDRTRLPGPIRLECDLARPLPKTCRRLDGAPEAAADAGR